MTNRISHSNGGMSMSSQSRDALTRGTWDEKNPGVNKSTKRGATKPAKRKGRKK